MPSHIRALPDGALEGITPEGTRHIEVLHLNRAPIIERRKMRLLLQTLAEREARLREQETQLDREIQRKKRTIRRRRR